MVQDQLVEYISSQMKTGVSRDIIKNTLVTAGWQAADVEDTLKKVEATKTSQPITASPAGMSAAATAAGVASISAAAKPAGAISSGPQTMKMSDLISTSDPAASTSTSASSSQKVFTGGIKPVEARPGATSFSSKEFSSKPSSSHGALITEIILGILIVAIGAFAGYLYFQNGTLNSKIASLNTQGTTATSQVAALQQAINASTTNWTSQVATLNGNNAELQTELSFYAVPPNTPSGATSTATLKGTLSGGGKVPYLITAMYGAKVYVSNSKDASVTAELAPLEASDTAAAFTGTYLPGADSMTLTAVNGTVLQ